MLNVELGIRHINSSFNIQHSTLNTPPPFNIQHYYKKMRFISWNVNGLRACVGKDFENQFKELDADFFCLQETKMQEGQLDLQFEGYESYWNYAEKKDTPVQPSIPSTSH